MKIIYFLFGSYKYCTYICSEQKEKVTKNQIMKHLLLKVFAVLLFATFIVLFVANVYTSIINIF